MTSLRTSPLRLAAAIVGFFAVAGSSVVAQDIPEVRPSVEIFGQSQFRAATPIEDAPSPPVPPAKFPFSVLEPDWQSAEAAAPRELRSERPIRVQPALIPTPTVEPAGQLLPVQSLQFPELKLPAVDAAAARLVSPVHEVPTLPVLTAPEEADLVDPPAYAPKPVSKTDASAEDLEGMLHSMLWITGTIGLGAVVSLWMIKLYLTRGGRAMLASKSLKLVDTLRIGPRCGVYLVQAETQRVLVGVEHGKTMCLMPLPEQFSESLDEAEGNAPVEESHPIGGFERVADVFTARRSHDERAKGATS
jgi:flagellar biogenesis protein FliO